MAGVFEIYVKTHFSAAHALTGYDGDCSRIHGHNWMVEVSIQCRKLDDVGIGIDFKDVKNAVEEITQGLDHCMLNDHPAFQSVNPTSENVAMFLYKQLGSHLNNEYTKVSRVKVFEAPGAGAAYWEE
ncbi:6-carboxytetrahydropterin synthase QueD [Desulfatibacillum aliphaticivorans]|uniref:6-carboxytetrahydropterin synthase QueD n=1 Tax=Desulfatibacillum aliphaticivorans TaxID=218208 RepID=UPI0004057E14|nr:6-carboxytetrahydropterin synthase QueD [Desulfatibacillum aliphaticivorans]